MKKSISQIFQRISDRSTYTGFSPEPWRPGWQSPEDLWSRAMAITFPANDSFPRKQMQLSAIETGRGGHRFKEIKSPGEFSGLRAYQPGDEPRFIDWRATARMRQPVVRQWSVESRSAVAIFVDVSASMYSDFNSMGQRLIDRAFDIALLIAAAALARQIPVRLVLATDQIEWHSGGLVGRDKILGLFEFLLKFEPSSKNTNWSQTDFQSIFPEPGQWLFLVSDFLWLPDPITFSEMVGKYRTHGIHLISNQKYQFSYDNCVDPETGQKHAFNLTETQSANRLVDWQKIAGVPTLSMDSDLNAPEIALSSWLHGESFDKRINSYND